MNIKTLSPSILNLKNQGPFRASTAPARPLSDIAEFKRGSGFLTLE
jgi:hypothetical protein